MKSRMDKYENDIDGANDSVVTSRTKKNQKLYREVSSLELEDFDLNSNVSVIANNTENINLDEIKDILDKKYHEKQRNKSFGNTDEISLPKINLDETREYDLNSVLEKAKGEKEVNYEEDRLKKIRNTQYDILKSLDVMNNEEEPDEQEDMEEKAEIKVASSKESQKIHDLIDTITAKEISDDDIEISGEMDPLDLLSDLKGDDDSTKVMGMLDVPDDEINDFSLEKEDTLGIDVTEVDGEDVVTKDEIEESLNNENDAVKKDKKKTEKISLDDSFVGKTTTFTQSDFDDFDDLKEDMHVTKIIIRLMVIVIVLAFIVGVVILANNYLNLGLF